MRCQLVGAVAVAVCLACALGAPRGAPGQATSIPFRPRPPLDRGADAMRREAAARKKELDGNFARIATLGGGGVPAAGVVMRKQAVAVAPAMAFAVRAGNGNLDPQIQQWVQQFRPTLRVEYQFVRTVCDPSKDERKRLARAAERALKDAATEFAEWQSGRRRVPVGGKFLQPVPAKSIQQGIAAAVKANLSPGQAARYQEEAARRAADQREAAVLNLVAKFDQDLALSADQREKLRASLSANWDDSWCQSLQMFMYDNQYFPQIPDQFISPILNPVQRRVWTGTQKVQQNFFGGGVMMGNDPLDDEDLREAAEAAQKEGAKK